MRLFISIALAAALVSAAESPFACNTRALTAEARHRHFDELGPKLRELHKGVRELPDGYEFGFAADPATVQLVSEWAAGEHLCCPFFDIALRFEREGGGLWLRLTGRPGTKEFIRSDLARWL
jgi:hypothetical protein